MFYFLFFQYAKYHSEIEDRIYDLVTVSADDYTV